MQFQDYIRQLSEAPPKDYMTQALRRKQQLGELGMITGDDALTRVGASLVDSSGSEAWRNAQMGQQREGILSRALESEEDRRFQGEQNRLMRALQRDVASMRNDGLSGKDVARYTRALSADLNRAGLPEIQESIAQVDKVLADFEPGADLPGVGLGKYNVGQDARAFRGKLAPIRNILLKARSGAAVTKEEYERFSEELLGEGVLASDADFWRSWNDLKERIAAHEESIIAGYDPEIVDIYNSRREKPTGKYSIGQELTVNGQRVRIVGLDDPNDPDVELID